jgi:hypothetical protein
VKKEAQKIGKGDGIFCLTLTETKIIFRLFVQAVQAFHASSTRGATLVELFFSLVSPSQNQISLTSSEVFFAIAMPEAQNRK